MKGFIENIKFRFFKLIHRCKICRRNAYLCWFIKKDCVWNEEERKEVTNEDCHRSLREQIECELRNNLTPDIRYKEVAEDGI